MQIQIDSREKARAITKIVNEFNQQNIKYYVSKLWVGDYMSLDNPRLIIDRKQNLTELCSNVCNQHDRFRNELIRAHENDIQIVILVEHGKDIECLEDVIWWKNPREEKRIKEDGKWNTIQTKAMKGETLYKILGTLHKKYGVEFQFCTKEQTGKKIIEILGGAYD
ncbi:MAG: ERCC4 domain-containing protein [Lachnotalea sp.]